MTEYFLFILSIFLYHQKVVISHKLTSLMLTPFIIKYLISFDIYYREKKINLDFDYFIIDYNMTSYVNMFK